MGCNGGRELMFLKWRVVRAAPLNPAVIRTEPNVTKLLDCK